MKNLLKLLGAFTISLSTLVTPGFSKSPVVIAPHNEKFIRYDAFENHQRFVAYEKAPTVHIRTEIQKPGYSLEREVKIKSGGGYRTVEKKLKVEKFTPGDCRSPAIEHVFERNIKTYSTPSSFKSQFEKRHYDRVLIP
jgi:hypothetical protein